MQNFDIDIGSLIAISNNNIPVHEQFMRAMEGYI